MLEGGNRVVPARVPTTAQAATTAPAQAPAPQASRPPQVARTGKQQRDWKTGKVLDSETSRDVYVTGSTSSDDTTGTISHDSGAGSTIDTHTTGSTTVHRVTVKRNELLILGDVYVYSIEDSTRRGGAGLLGVAVQAVANRKHGCRFVVGEEIKYWQEKSLLHVIDVDGKECKADILRQERLHR